MSFDSRVHLTSATDLDAVWSAGLHALAALDEHGRTPEQIHIDTTAEPRRQRVATAIGQGLPGRLVLLSGTGIEPDMQVPSGTRTVVELESNAGDRDREAVHRQFLNEFGASLDALGADWTWQWTADYSTGGGRGTGIPAVDRHHVDA